MLGKYLAVLLWVAGSGLATMGAACGGLACSGPATTGPAKTGPAKNRPTKTGPAKRPERPAEGASLPGAVPTEPLMPGPIHVRLADLPAPFATQSARRPPEVIPPPSGARLRVPAGFVVQLLAADLPNARWLAETPDGRLLLAQSRDHRITWLADRDRDGVAEGRGVLADADDGLDLPFGMAFVGDALYVGNQDRVLRFPWRRGQETLTGPGDMVLRLPGGGYRQHWTRNVLASADRTHLFVSVGSQSNVDPEPAPRASILRVGLDGSARAFASGLRNPVGLALHPRTGELYTNVNERDLLGDGLVPDYFTRVDDGAFYGWPYAYLHPDNLDPRRVVRPGVSEAPALAARTRTPDVLFEAHSAALGLTFYREASEGSAAFPARYRRGAFACFRGSWNRSSGTGYKLVFIPFGSDDRPLGHYEDFVTGFLVDPSGPTTWGRPVGLLSGSDGALYFTDEANGRVYRVRYQLG